MKIRNKTRALVPLFCSFESYVRLKKRTKMKNQSLVNFCSHNTHTCGFRSQARENLGVGYKMRLKRAKKRRFVEYPTKSSRTQCRQSLSKILPQRSQRTRRDGERKVEVIPPFSPPLCLFSVISVVKILLRGCLH